MPFQNEESAEKEKYMGQKKQVEVRGQENSPEH